MVIGGQFGNLLVREKSTDKLEIGELLIGDIPDGKVLFQVFDLIFGSQISQQNLELISGLQLEENSDLQFFDGHLRNYNLAKLKSLIAIKDNVPVSCKLLPNFFTEVQQVEEKDIQFITKPRHPLFMGHLRSGSKVLQVPVYLDGEKVFSHHILIPATTGKGKSNLTKVMLWQSVQEDWCGLLVLDPHDEYYGRNKIGLKDHPNKERVVYYTPSNPPVGSRLLRIHFEMITPYHFQGVVHWSDAQRDCLHAYYKQYQNKWIEAIIQEQPVESKFHEMTLGVIKRRLSQLLHIEKDESGIRGKGVFHEQAGTTTISDIVQDLEKGRLVIIDTSMFDGSVEILIGSLIATEILHRYKRHMTEGIIKDKPVISIVIEEAPRVLGKEVLERGPNIFSTIAREGRKFKVGLTAITQLPSLIPREILANMNTKIILGTEMKPERQAIIESAAQDLSDDDRNIASLDKGECLITSNFAHFAMPIKIPLFEEWVQGKKEAEKKSYPGVQM